MDDRNRVEGRAEFFFAYRQFAGLVVVLDGRLVDALSFGVWKVERFDIVALFTISNGCTPAFKATTMITPATGERLLNMLEANCIGRTSVTALYSKPGFILAAKLERLMKVPLPLPDSSVTAPVTRIKRTRMKDEEPPAA